MSSESLDQMREKLGSQRAAFRAAKARPAIQLGRVLGIQDAPSMQQHSSQNLKSSGFPRYVPSSIGSIQTTQQETRSATRDQIQPQAGSQVHQTLQSYPSPTTSKSTPSPPDKTKLSQKPNPNTFVTLFPPSLQGTRGHATYFQNSDRVPFSELSHQMLDNANHRLLQNASYASALAPTIFPGSVEDTYGDVRQAFQLPAEIYTHPFRQPRPQPLLASAINPGFNSNRFNYPSTSSTPSTHSRNSFSNNTSLQSSVSYPSTAATSTAQCISGFRPSHMLLVAQGVISDREKPQDGTHYQGDVNSKSYLSVIHDLPPHENAALWVTNIPLSAKHIHLFDLIHEGAVWALHMCEPTDTHPTRAAKLIFKSPQAAGNFFVRANTGFGIQVHGTTLKVMYNRDGHRARTGHETRILLIEGPGWMMNYEFWENQFTNACIYQLDRWLYLPSPDLERPRMEFRFARVDGQSQTCKQKISMDPALAICVTVQYGLDPCDGPFMRYAIAAQKQQPVLQ